MLNLIKTQKTYQEYIKFKIIVIVLMGIITVAAAIFAVAAGSAGLTIKEVLLALVGQGTDITKTVVLNLRLTRVVTSIVQIILKDTIIMVNLLRILLILTYIISVLLPARFVRELTC